MAVPIINFRTSCPLRSPRFRLAEYPSHSSSSFALSAKYIGLKSSGVASHALGVHSIRTFETHFLPRFNLSIAWYCIPLFFDSEETWLLILPTASLRN